MNRGAKITLISLGIVAIMGTAAYFIWFRDKGGKKNQKPVGDVDANEEQKVEKKKKVEIEKKSNPKRYSGESRPLKKYDFGNNVKCLQKLLNWRGYTDNKGKVLVVDGRWGDSTEQAIDKSIADGVDWGIVKGTGGITITSLKNRVAWTAGVNKTPPLVGQSYLKDTIECKSASCCASVEQLNLPVDASVLQLNQSEDYVNNQYLQDLMNKPIVAVQDNTGSVGYGFFSGDTWFNKQNMN